MGLLRRIFSVRRGVSDCLKTQISFVECSRFMALAAGAGEEGSVKAALGAARRSERSGEPLRVPTGRAKRLHEAGARDEGEI